MKLVRFMNESGFKILAAAQLSQCEYSIILYLLNCYVSGLETFITNTSELALLIGYDEADLKEAMQMLSSKNMIRLKFSDSNNSHGPDQTSISIGFQTDTKKWQLQGKGMPGSAAKDAVVYPFRRGHLMSFPGKDEQKEKKQEIQTWERIFDSFIQGRSLDDDEIQAAEDAARVLTETHPVDQVLLFIRHFGLRIPTLSLLASSWQHYSELFESENLKIDMMDARRKHHEVGEQLRAKARDTLGRSDDLSLVEEERSVLEILIRHRHPRRQLFWAYQLRNRYPNLLEFFDDTKKMMLPVTSLGTVIKKSSKSLSNKE